MDAYIQDSANDNAPHSITGGCPADGFSNKSGLCRLITRPLPAKSFKEEEDDLCARLRLKNALTEAGNGMEGVAARIYKDQVGFFNF